MLPAGIFTEMFLLFLNFRRLQRVKEWMEETCRYPSSWQRRPAGTKQKSTNEWPFRFLFGFIRRFRWNGTGCSSPLFCRHPDTKKWGKTRNAILRHGQVTLTIFNLKLESLDSANLNWMKFVRIGGARESQSPFNAIKLTDGQRSRDLRVCLLSLLWLWWWWEAGRCGNYGRTDRTGMDSAACFWRKPPSAIRADQLIRCLDQFKRISFFTSSILCIIGLYRFFKNISKISFDTQQIDTLRAWSNLHISSCIELM